MYAENRSNCLYLCAIISVVIFNSDFGQSEQLVYRKPWPTYSLQNMPQTRFTCHDKILGGYYADAETQCQMFHVCVKVASVGIQDFRFLCPNGTAFDQEAQICADWADVDCEQSVLYYGSDNFDLYRIGSGFESKRAPLAEEDEATFHLQRAESVDIRRSKETRIDQRLRPDEPPNYTKHFEDTTRNSIHKFANVHANNSYPKQQTHKQFVQQQKQTINNGSPRKPIVNYYTPITVTPSTTIATTTRKTGTTERYNDDSKQDLDEIFKGSHSSNFFSNRYEGRETDFHLANKMKITDLADYDRNKAEQPAGQHPTRSKRIKAKQTSIATLKPTTTKLNFQTTLQANSVDYIYPYKSIPTSSPNQRIEAINNVLHLSNQTKTYDYLTQEKIKPTTFNPGNIFYHLKTTTSKYNNLNRHSLDIVKQNEISISNENVTLKPSVFLNTSQNSYTKGRQAQQTLEHQRVQTPSLLAAPKPFEKNIDRQIERSKYQDHQSQDYIYKQTPEKKPRGFSRRGSINYKPTNQGKTDSSSTSTQRATKKFSTLVPKDQYNATTSSPTTNSRQYDTLYRQTQPTIKSVPRSPITSSTSKTQAPTTTYSYHNPDEDDGQYHPELYELEFIRQLPKSSATVKDSIIPATTSTPKIFNNVNNPQNQRRQHRPIIEDELSDEDEVFKTAPSLNFGAASINKLRADIIKIEKTSQQYNSQYKPIFSNSSLHESTITEHKISPTTFIYPLRSSLSTTSTTKPISTSSSKLQSHSTITTSKIIKQKSNFYENDIKSVNEKLQKGTKKYSTKLKSSSNHPTHANEDTSYDYAYYDTDTLSESPQDYADYGIAEFSKTPKN